MSKKLIIFTIFSIGLILFGIIMTVFGIMNVSTLYVEHDFPSAFLEQDRNLIVYVPPGYDLEMHKRYPVLYLLDGELYFKENKEESRNEWSMKKTLDRLIKDGALDKMIVVGIYSTEDRKAEYSSTELLAEESRLEALTKFIVEEVKPFIDLRYRTLAGVGSTGIAGADLGGFAALYTGLKHTETFSKIGALSPENSELLQENLLSAEKDQKKLQRIWMDTEEEQILDGRLENMLLYLYGEE
ncbi:alpha/beta hydrolase [Caldalkalibacillus mannanilyticus]|uniref:alpha/beta hydrolase n=1 Tax=Caldalkalibacillus mannanilyticus TaxID=1418 RepID=UPI000469826B|nr:alpha/beta hydrolase-fold protein [Caldalkalibacillus mannanilyticus]